LKALMMPSATMPRKTYKIHSKAFMPTPYEGFERCGSVTEFCNES
jgi:hypothetical protein